MTFHYDHNNYIGKDKEKIDEVIQLIKKENPGFCKIFDDYNGDERIREEIYSYIYKFEGYCLQSNHLNPMQKHYSQQAINVLKNLFSTRSEKIAGFSILKSFKRCLKKDYSDISLELAYELLFLFRALKGTNGQDKEVIELNSNEQFKMANLDAISRKVKKWISRYPSGLDDSIIKRRLNNQKLIKAKYGITDQEWNSWEWQRENVIRDLPDLNRFIMLSESEMEAIKIAATNEIPFGITPYYLSLLDLDGKGPKYDHAIRTQAIPQYQCIKRYLELRETNKNSITNDFEHILPEISITRGYPMTAIFKPIYNSSRSLCIYSEKNWEMNYSLWQENSIQTKIERATGWFRNHAEVNEILITGDILMYEESIIEDILSQLADITHIQRIRISSKMPVILPFRITNSLIHLLTSYQITGRREVSLMTHFEHPYEVTLEAMRAIQKLSKAGIHVYNQSVYTIDNSRRFEMAALRKQLRLIGVDPYYSFNANKNLYEERVPIARMLQEQNEESRLAPGLDRADEAVLTIPGVGKNYLRIFQEHQLIMILKDGSRLYEFYPSDVYLDNNKPFLYQDMSIYSFLNQLAIRDEDINEYQSIWYYY